MNVLIGTLLLSWLVVGMVLVFVDICEECRFQTREAEREELLDELWSDEAA